MSAVPDVDVRLLPLAEAERHLPALAKWSYAEWGDKEKDTVPGVLSWLEGILADDFEDGVVAVVGEVGEERAIGSALLIRHDLDLRMDLSPWLANVYVAPEFRRKGLARLMVRRIDELARRRGVREYYLYTLGVEPLYAKLGWVEVEQFQRHGQRFTVMRRTLT